MTSYYHEPTKNGYIVKDRSNRIAAFIEGNNYNIVGDDKEAIKQYCKENKLCNFAEE